MVWVISYVRISIQTQSETPGLFSSQTITLNLPGQFWKQSLDNPKYGLVSSTMSLVKLTSHTYLQGTQDITPVSLLKTLASQKWVQLQLVPHGNSSITVTCSSGSKLSLERFDLKSRVSESGNISSNVNPSFLCHERSLDEDLRVKASCNKTKLETRMAKHGFHNPR